MELLYAFFPPLWQKAKVRTWQFGPSMNWPSPSASSQMMNKAPPCLYSSDSRMRGTFCFSQVSDRNVLSAGSVASQGRNVFAGRMYQTRQALLTNRRRIWPTIPRRGPTSSHPSCAKGTSYARTAVAGKSNNAGQRSLSSRLGRAREASLTGVTNYHAKAHGRHRLGPRTRAGTGGLQPL